MYKIEKKSYGIFDYNNEAFEHDAFPICRSVSYTNRKSDFDLWQNFKTFLALIALYFHRIFIQSNDHAWIYTVVVKMGKFQPIQIPVIK